MEAVVALDVGGTVIKGALVAADGSFLRSRRWPTGREAGPEAVVERILGAAAELVETARAELDGYPRAAGVAVPGAVDEERGTAAYSANIGWRDLPLRSLLADRLQLPTALAHDVRAASLGEGAFGAARGLADYLFVGIGTGIGGGIVAGGQALRGAHGLAAEIGHVLVQPEGPLCGCGARGCLETLASASAIARRYQARTGAAEATAEDVAGLVAAGDPAAGEVWETAVHALAVALAQCVTLLDPAAVVVGGGLSASGEMLLSPLRAALASRLSFQAMPEIRRGQLGDGAGCAGAALLAWARSTAAGGGRA
jgi:glucokinase